MTVLRTSLRNFLAHKGRMALSAVAVLLSVAQMAQYWMGILPMADTTWTQYRALFLRFQ